ncbi:MAG: hypothetical protein Q9194_007414 [Teloschistes cf. exilis]
MSAASTPNAIEESNCSKGDSIKVDRSSNQMQVHLPPMSIKVIRGDGAENTNLHITIENRDHYSLEQQSSFLAKPSVEAWKFLLLFPNRMIHLQKPPKRPVESSESKADGEVRLLMGEVLALEGDAGDTMRKSCREWNDALTELHSKTKLLANALTNEFATVVGSEMRRID